MFTPSIVFNKRFIWTKNSSKYKDVLNVHFLNFLNSLLISGDTDLPKPPRIMPSLTNMFSLPTNESHVISLIKVFPTIVV